MSRPLKAQSHDGATSAEAGEDHYTKAHTAIGIYVQANNLEPANDTLTVSLEVGFEYDGTDYFGPITTGSSDRKISESDFSDDDGDGNYEALLWASNVPAEKIRARITDFTDDANGDLTVDTYILVSNNASGGGHDFQSDL